MLDDNHNNLIQTGDMITIHVDNNISKPATSTEGPSGSCEYLTGKFSKRATTPSYYHLLYNDAPVCPPDFIINIKLIDMNMTTVSIKVHKVFLALESLYFRTLLNSEFTESTNSVVEFELTSVEKDIFEQIILRYIYGERTLDIDKGLPYACTLCLAHYLQISPLECQLLQQMTKTSKYTEQHLLYYSQLRDHSMLAVNSSFLSQSLTAFGKDISKKRDEVMNLPVEFFLWLVSLDNLNVSNEDEVFDLIQEYIIRNEKSIRQNNPEGFDQKPDIIEQVWSNVRVCFLSETKLLSFMDQPSISTDLKISMLRKKTVYSIYKDRYKKVLATKQQTSTETTAGNASMSVETNSGTNNENTVVKKEPVPATNATPTPSATIIANELMINLDDPQFIKRGNILEHLITGSKGVIQIWDVNTTECLSTFPTDSFVRCLALYERHYLFSGGHDKKIKKWNLRTNECELVLKGHHDYVLSFALVDDCLYSAGGVGDSTVKKWNLKSNQLEASLEGHQKAVLSLITYGDMFVFSGGEDSTIRKWNVRTNKCELTIQASVHGDDKLWCLATFGDSLFAGGSKGTIYQFNVNDGRLEREWSAHENIVWCLLVHEDYLFSGSKDKCVKRWNLNTPNTDMEGADPTNTPYVCEAIMREHTDSVRSLNVCNNYLFSGGGDEKIIKWSLLTNQKEAVVTAAEYICSALLA